MSQLKKAYSTVLKDEFPETMTITLGDEKLVYKKRSWNVEGDVKGLRYGENPDQPAALYQLVEGSLTVGSIRWRQSGNAAVSALTENQTPQVGKHPGKTNLTDVDNGANILQYLSERPACVIIKHNNPCGAAWVHREDGGIFAALYRAFWSDRLAAFGGAVVMNAPVTKECAELLAENYFEVVAAPAYENGTLDIFKRRKNLRVLEIPALGRLAEWLASAWLDIKSLADGGLIVQKSFQNRILSDADFLPARAVTPEGSEVMARFPDKRELEDLRFAWAVEAGVISNSVIFARDGVTLAVGAGEQDRVGCVELAVRKAYNKYADALAFKETGRSLYDLEREALKDSGLKERLDDIKARVDAKKGDLINSRMISDGFFPFRDGVDVAIAQGVAAIAHPGGSIRDAESIVACDEATPQVAMAFTGQRSFRH